MNNGNKIDPVLEAPLWHTDQITVFRKAIKLWHVYVYNKSKRFKCACDVWGVGKVKCMSAVITWQRQAWTSAQKPSLWSERVVLPSAPCTQSPPEGLVHLGTRLSCQVGMGREARDLQWCHRMWGCNNNTLVSVLAQYFCLKFCIAIDATFFQFDLIHWFLFICMVL